MLCEYALRLRGFTARASKQARHFSARAELYRKYYSAEERLFVPNRGGAKAARPIDEMAQVRSAVATAGRTIFLARPFGG